jgi:hypothetical protein
MNYDFNKISDCLNCLRDNNIINVTINTFSTGIIRSFGTQYLPMFEDVSRMFSILLTSSVFGNFLYSGIIFKVNEQLVRKLVYTGLSALRK